MTRILSSLLLGGLLGAPLAQAAPLPAATFFENPLYAQVQLSPDARHLAIKMGGAGQRYRLVVVNLEDKRMTTPVNFKDIDVHRFEWVNDKRLVYTTLNAEKMPGPGLFAVDLDGAHPRTLAVRSWLQTPAVGGAFRKRLSPFTWLLDQPGAQDSDLVYAVTRGFGNGSLLDSPSIVRVNTVTGAWKTVAGTTGDMHRYILDARGEPRLTFGQDKGELTIYTRDAAIDSDWRKLVSGAAYATSGRLPFHPIAFGPDDTLYVAARKASGGLAALHTARLDTLEISRDPVLNVPDFDFRGTPVISNGKLLGFRYLADAEGSVWFDPAMKTLQAEVDKLLPNTLNLVDVARRPQTGWVLVTAYSDRLPSTFYAYNTQSKKLMEIGPARPGVQAAHMAARELVRIKARDGRTIPTWVTVPDGEQKKLPMVVLVHGGPWMRGGTWSWNAQAQFLASRGYVVVEPEFRGSTGFGEAHTLAGLKEWGGKMQDDVADAAQWAVAQGVADPERICIAGGSYGGYSALMGLVNDGALYKCGIAWAAVTDMELLFNGSWWNPADTPEEFRKYGMPELIGDPVKDAARIRAVSPVLRAAQIKRPLLLAHGGADRRVPIQHGRRMLDALKEHGADVTWVEYEEEGHGWAMPKTRIDFWTKVEAFLGRHIGAR